jgi:tetratricopeptide (TPR) repeat protein
LAQAYPRAPLTQYELGVVLGGQGERVAAIAALRRAVALKRDLPEAWRALGDQLFAQGDDRGAEAAYAEHTRASVRSPSLKPAADALFDNDPALAQQLLAEQLKSRPSDTAALQMQADALARLGELDRAEQLLTLCVEIDPAFDGARLDLASLLFRQQNGAKALPHLQRLLSQDPNEVAYRSLMAACLSLIGEYDQAIEIYHRLLAEYPSQPRIWLNLGHALRTVGRREEAVAAYGRSIALAPHLGEAYWSLANLKTVPFSAEDVAGMQTALQHADLTDDGRLHLHYALGKALEDISEPRQAFEHYAAGAALRRGQVHYDADEMTTFVTRSKTLLTPAFFAARAGFGHDSGEPIFIVGLPRSGSTLVEQILASHSAVEGTMELPDIALIARALDGANYPDVLADVARADLAALGAAYLEGVRIHRRLGRRLFIDKMPNNFHHIGLIQLILPSAKIIDVRRHPLGSCFSAFKQHFAQGQAFSYDLAELGRYYRDYVELMAHFDGVLPGRIHRLIYDDLVEDMEGEVRRLLDYCGLPFEAACLKFYENERAVRTVSSEQVRRPIFREGLSQWRAYEPWMAPLRAALGPALDKWRA